MARPKKNSARLKMRNNVFRSTDDDVLVFKERAAQCGMSRSEYHRQMGLHGKIVVQKSQKADPETVSEVTRIGVLINQLVRKANATGTFLTERLADEIAALRPILERLLITGTEGNRHDSDHSRKRDQL